MQGRTLHEVDKATVKDLVRQQIAIGKPLYAPWYRDEDNASPGRRRFGNENRPRFGPHPRDCCY